MQHDHKAPLPARKHKVAPVNILLFFVMFFSTWGSGLQNLSSVDLAKIFPILSILLIGYAAAFVKKKIVFPRAFNWFVAFYLLHLAVTYGVFHTDEFILGYVGQVQQSEAFVAIQEGAGVTCLRLFIFLAFAYSLAALLWKKERLHYASAGYAAGLLAVLFLGGYVSSETHRINAGEIRNAGGFLDPNSFGFSGLTAVTLALIALTNAGKSKFLRLLHLGSAVVGGVAVLQSGSRTSMIGCLLAFAVILVYMREMSRKVALVLAAALIGVAAFALLPAAMYDSLKERASLSRMQADRGANRLDIWSNYLSEFPQYALTGVGFLQSRSVIRESYTSEFAITHNQYLEILVETGVIGLLLFLNAIARLWLWISRIPASEKSRLKPMLLAALVGLFVEFMFLNSFYSRDTWIIFGMVAGLYYHRREYA